MPNGSPLTSSGDDISNNTVMKEAEPEPLSIVGIPNGNEKVVLFEFYETVHVWWLIMTFVLLLIAI